MAHHHHDKHKDKDDKKELRELGKIEHDLRQENAILREIRDELRPPHLTSVELAFTRGNHMATVGPVTLKSGQSTVASIVYLDQFGQPMPAGFTPPAVTFGSLDPAVASIEPQPDGQTAKITWVGGGATDLTASVLGPSGANLSDTKTVTCVPPDVETPVLTSIEIAFDDPSGGTAPTTASAKSKK